MEKMALARELFLSGHNCAQSVVLSFADDMQFSKELARKISAGFGGGMGKMQETCGAVTGAVMVLGILGGEKAESNEALKSVSYSLVKELFRQFHETYGSTLCRDLTGCDLNTPEGAQRFKEEKFMEQICAGCVTRAVQIVESLTK
jgi:C_GCAxxG_C_C family probable redox protein